MADDKKIIDRAKEALEEAKREKQHREYIEKIRDNTVRDTHPPPPSKKDRTDDTD